MSETIHLMGWELHQPPTTAGIWISSLELSRHLGESDPAAILRIYRRYRQHFRDQVDSVVCTVDIAGQMQEMRLFSERGTIKLLQYAATPAAYAIIDEVFEVFRQYRAGKASQERVWPIVGQQGRLISLIAEECHKDRRRLDDLEAKVHALDEKDRRIAALEAQIADLTQGQEHQEECIDAREARVLRELVHKLATESGSEVRSVSSRLWHAFKGHFGVHSYHNLPKRRFPEAVAWLQQQPREPTDHDLPLFDHPESLF